jgi:hypothetical protein
MADLSAATTVVDVAFAGLCCVNRELPMHAVCVCGEEWARHLFKHPHGRPCATPTCERFQLLPGEAE